MNDDGVNESREDTPPIEDRGGGKEPTTTVGGQKARRGTIATGRKAPLSYLKAQLLSEIISQELGEAHRGAFPYGDSGVVVVFGNDCFVADPRSQRSVDAVRDRVSQLDATEMNFAVSRDGVTWVLVVIVPDALDVQEAARALEDAAWDGWMGGRRSERNAFEVIQRTIARRVLDGTWPAMQSEKNPPMVD